MAARLLANMGWVDVEEYLRTDDRIILPIGSTEQHGRHLIFSTDSIVPEEIARRASEATGVIAAPVVAYGMSLHHLNFPGSIGLRPGTLTATLEDILLSLYHHGFRRVAISNGHGGNIASINSALINVMNDRPDLDARNVSWYQEPSLNALINELWPGKTTGHATADETSAVMALRPEAVRLDRAQFSPDAPPLAVLTRTSFRTNYPHGVIGTADPKLASAEAGERLLASAAAALVARLNAWGPRPAPR
jgi:creatinine amidohydrolase